MVAAVMAMVDTTIITNTMEARRSSIALRTLAWHPVGTTPPPTLARHQSMALLLWEAMVGKGCQDITTAPTVATPLTTSSNQMFLVDAAVAAVVVGLHFSLLVCSTNKTVSHSSSNGEAIITSSRQTQQLRRTTLQRTAETNTNTDTTNMDAALVTSCLMRDTKIPRWIRAFRWPTGSFPSSSPHDEVRDTAVYHFHFVSFQWLLVHSTIF